MRGDRFALWTPKVKIHSTPVPPHHLDQASRGAPRETAAAPGGGRRHTSEQREVFTVWMESLMLNGSGCTVFDSAGRVVYRVDNYRFHRSADVCLMDVAGDVVLQVLRKFGRWEGFRWGERDPAARARARPWFTVVSKAWRGRGSRCEFRSDGVGNRAVCYRMVDVGKQRQEARVARIVGNATGLIVAEVKRKTTVAGVTFGDDVLTLVVEPNVDQTLIMGLLVVHGLINHTSAKKKKNMQVTGRAN